nr:E3 ubiquitin-protein ligase RNF4-like isoform X2 [Taeniopygia guttata]
MSSRQRKRPGGAVDSRPARKRSRLLPSSAGGTSQTEPTDLEERGTPAFEPDVIDLTGEDTIDLTGEDENAIDVAGEEVIQLRYEGVIHLPGESSEPEVITISDDESSMDREQSQQQLNLSRTSDEPLARGDEEEPRDIDDEDWLLFDFDPPYWSDEDSEDREQNQQYPHVSSAAGNSADVLASNDEEEPRDVEGYA